MPAFGVHLESKPVLPGGVMRKAKNAARFLQPSLTSVKPDNQPDIPPDKF
jgi:hypothetical protein